MWKAAFSGRSETGGPAGASVSGRSSKDNKDESRRKKSGHSNRAESVISSTSRRDDDRERERRRSGKGNSLYENGSRYDTASSFASPNTSAYATAPTSRVGETRPLTESALRMLPGDDDDEWEDEDKDARSERKSKRKGSGDEKRRKSSRGEKERSRSRSRERKDRKKESSRTLSGTEKAREKDKDRVRRQPELVSEGSRAIPEMGSFEQFPGQYVGGHIGPAPQQEAMMSGALPSPAPQQQFPGQDLYRPQMPAQPSRADSYGHAAEYYLDEGQSVEYQPGNRPFTPNMLANPDTHLQAASAQANPAQDTGHGSAADFFNGKVSPVYSAPTTPAKPPKPGKQTSWSAGKPSKPSRMSSSGTAAAALAAAGGVGAVAGSSHHHSSSMQQSASSSYYQQAGGSSSKPTRPARPNSDGDVYYAPPTANGTYPPTLSSTQGYGPPPYSNTTGTQGKQSANSNIPLYAAGAAAAGLAAHQYSQHHYQNGIEANGYNMASFGNYGGGQGPPKSPRPHGGHGYYPPSGPGGGGISMQHQHLHEHKGPLTRLKDGFFNLISTPEDTAKMEMYTEYIGVCKYCFDPRTSAGDAPRVHHYHKRRDSFEDIRRRRSYDRISRKGSNDSLRRQNGVRVDKDSRYYASDSSRRKRDSGGAGILGAGLAAAGVAAGANALFGDRKNFDDTYSVKSGHRESSAVRRRSRSSSREQRRQSTYGTVRPRKDEFVTVRCKDGTLERRRVQRSRSSSRERRSGYLGAATAGAALGAAGLAASSRRRSESRSRSRSPTIIGSFGANDNRSRINNRKAPSGSSRYNASRNDHESEEQQGIFGGFFSPPQRKRRGSHEQQRKRRGFFTFSNGSSSSSNSELAFGEGFSSKTSLPLRRKASSSSNRAGRRRSRRNSDDHIAATVAGIGATAAALAAAKKGNRISTRTSRPELGRRRDVRYSTGSDLRNDETLSSEDQDWEDELPSDVDDDSSVDGGLAFGDYGGKRLSSRQSLESVGSQSSAGGLSAWGWRWGGKDKKRRRGRPSYQESATGPFAGPVAAATAAGAVVDSTRPINKPVYLDDTGRPLPGMESISNGSVPAGPMQYVDPAPISDSSSLPASRYPSMPGAFEQEPPIIRPGPAPLQQPQPMSPARPAFTQSPPDMEDTRSSRPDHPRRSNSSPTRGTFAQDAALIGAGALATAGILAGTSGRRSKEASNVRFGLTDEQQRKEDRERRRQDQKSADEERRRADRTRALKEEADRAAREARQEEVRRAREEENRKAAELALERQRAAKQEAEEQAKRAQEREAAKVERERLEQEARDRREAAAAAAAEVEKHQRAREEAQRQAEIRERERREWEEAYAKEQSRSTKDAQQSRDAGQQRKDEQQDRYNEPQSRQDNNRGSSSAWGSAAAGAAAAATVGAVMAGREHKKSRNRKSRDASYYDEGHSDWQERRTSSDLQGYDNEDPRQSGFERRVEDQYGRGSTGVEYRDGYAAAEIQPKHEHDGEPLMDDDLYNPNFFKEKHTPAENAKYVEFARKAADKVVADREGAYSDKTTYADFFAPKELLTKAAEGKTRSVSPIGDNEVQVWHASEGDVPSHVRSSDYGYGRSKHAPYGVPKLNVISPTPPPGSTSSSPESKRNKKAQSGSPLSKVNDDSFAESAKSEKSERSRSISWGEDKTHIYDVQTPDSFQERDSYISSPGSDAAKAAAGVAGVAGAAAGGAALHEIVVEDPSGGKRTFHEREASRREPTRGNDRGFDNKADSEDVTPSPEPESGGFYRQPFFESVSDMGTGIFGMDSPGTEGAPPQRGFVEGETDEPTPAEERRQRIPGDFDDEDDTDRAKSASIDPVTAEIEKEQAAAGAADESKSFEELAWEPPLSKKEKKKREKAAKRSGSLPESSPATLRQEDESAPLPSSTAIPETEPLDYFSGMSKKEKKKAKKQGLADIATSMMSDQVREPVAEPEDPVAAAPAIAEPEPPLTKKEQKRRDKEAKKQGQSFADVTDSILAAGGIAAAAAATGAIDSTEDSGSGSSKKKKKGKKAKLGEPMYDDPRDAGPSESTRSPNEPASEPTGMPGSWNSDPEWKTSGLETEHNASFNSQDNQEPTPPAVPEPPTSQDADPWAEFAEPKSKKKKNKRSSIAFNIPEVSSPLRSEIPMDDYVGTKDLAEESARAEEKPLVNGKAVDVTQPGDRSAETGSDKLSGEQAHDEEGPMDRSSRRGDDLRQISPDDSRSVVSAPTPDEGRRKSRREHSRGGDYFDEPSYAYETGSVAASEPADVYESSKKSKRRSRHADDDDTASVVSSRSRRDREKEESPSSSRKEKKGGIFGLFSRKSTDDYKSSSGRDKESRSDGASLNRVSTRDSRGSRDEDDDESRRRRKKKSRDSQYGDDDDDTRSVKSESRRSRHRSEDDRDDETRERRRRSGPEDDYDGASPVRSESGRKHHHRRRTDDDGESLSRRGSRDDSRSAVSESGRRHHHRRRTDEDAYRPSSRDQSFLGMRVEDLPPLPDSRPVSPDSVAEKQERGEGSPADAESGSGLVKTPDRPDAIVAKETPESPVAALETPSRPASLNRPISSTAVPLRFPFGHAPQTPGSARDRSQSFTSPTSTTAPPTSPASAKQSRQGRPNSTEFRPLYLVERNRKTPEVEDALPSLPSSKPSSRASSIHGSDDNYQSAVEEMEAESPDSRGLTIDTSAASAHHAEDYLDSEETTPKASEFPRTTSPRHVKQEPQFYTWEDFAREERMHDHQYQPEEPLTATREQMPSDSIPLAPTRSKSPSKHGQSHASTFKSAAAAAMLGTAAVYAHHRSKDDSPERTVHAEPGAQSMVEGNALPEGHSYPLPAPVLEGLEGPEPVEEPSVSRKGSKKKKSKKKREQSTQAEEGEALKTAVVPDFQATQETEGLSRLREVEPRADFDAVMSEVSAEGQNTQDDVIYPSAAAHTIPSLPESGDTVDDGHVSREGAESSHPAQVDAGFAPRYEIPSTKSEPAPLVTEQQTVEAGGVEESNDFASAPRLTRKQSKKAKKKQKAATLFEADPVEEQPSSLEAQEEKGSKSSTVDREVDLESRHADRTITADDNEVGQDGSDASGAQEPAPQAHFSTSDFNEVAHQSSSGWQESQAQAFRSMLQESRSRHMEDSTPLSSEPASLDAQTPIAEPDNAEENEQQLREEPFESFTSKKKAKKDKKKRQSLAWSETGERSEEVAQDRSHQELEAGSQTASEEFGMTGTAIAGGLAAVAGSIGLDQTAGKQSKKKAKKDKKKSALPWTEVEADADASLDLSEASRQEVDPKAELGDNEINDNLVTQPLPDEPAGEINQAPSEQTTNLGQSDVEIQQSRELGQDLWSDPPSALQEPLRGADAPVTSKKQSKKDKKKQKKAAANADPEPEQDSPSRQMSFDDTAFVDATETQCSGDAGVSREDQPPGEWSEEQSKAIHADDAAPEAAAPQEEFDAFTPASAKKNKKDRKKKKTQAGFEPETEPVPEAVDEADFVDAIETQPEKHDPAPDAATGPADIPLTDEAHRSEKPNSREIEDTQAEAAQAEETFGFEPVSKKKSKKDKKKKSVSFSWDVLDADEPSESPVTQEGSEDPANESSKSLEPSLASEPSQGASEGNADASELEKLQSETIMPFDAQSAEPTSEDGGFDSSSVSKKKSKKDKKKKKQAFDWNDPELESATVQDVSGDSGRETHTQDTRADEAPIFDEAVTAPKLSKDDAQTHTLEGIAAVEQDKPSDEAAPEPEIEELKSAIKKKSKKDKKRRQTFDWTEPESSSAAGGMDAANTLGPEMGDARALPSTSDESRQDLAKDLSTIDDNPQPHIASLDGPAQPSTQESDHAALDTNDQSSEAPAAERPAESDSLSQDSVPGGGVQDPTNFEEDHVKQDASSVLPDNEKPAAEPALEDFAPTVSRKKSKKDKKKKQALDWGEIEPELPSSKAHEDIAPAETPNDGADTSEQGVFTSSQPEVVGDQPSYVHATEDTPPGISGTDAEVTPEHGAKHPEPQPSEETTSLTRKQSKKDKKKKKRQQQQDWQSEPDNEDSVAAEAPKEAPYQEEAQSSEADPQDVHTAQGGVQQREAFSDPSEADNNARAESGGKESTKMPSDDGGPDQQEAQIAPDAVDLDQSTQEIRSDGDIQEPVKDNQAEEWSWEAPTKKGKRNKKGRKSVFEQLPVEERFSEDRTAEQASEAAKVSTMPVERSGQSWDDMVNEDQAVQFEAVANEPAPTAAIDSHGESKAEAYFDSQAKTTVEPGPDAFAPTNMVSNEPELGQTSSDLQNSTLDSGEPQDGSWAIPASSKKKNKKDKKSKTSGASTPVIEKPLSANDEPVSAGDLEVASTSIAPTFKEETPIAFEEGRHAAGVPTGEDFQDDIWAAPSGKKKKGKKSKMSITDLPPFETTETVGTAAPDEASGEPEPGSIQEGEINPAEAKVGDADGESATAHDAWAIHSSQNKKGKKSRKSNSGPATPVAEELEHATGLSDGRSASENNLVEPDSAGNGQDGVVVEYDTVPGETEPVLPTNPTFDDVWAEEEIATHEDPDSVRDLVGDPPEPVSSTWQPLSSKKARKKKGKRGSIAATMSSGELERPKPTEEPIIDSQDTPMGQGTLETHSNSLERDQELTGEETPAAADDEPRSRNPVAADIAETQTSEFPLESTQGDHVPEEDWAVPQTSKKSKKGKKNRQMSADETVAQADVSDPWSTGVSAMDTVQKEGSAEVEPNDEWSLQAKPKKSKKGKKGKQSLSEEQAEPLAQSSDATVTPADVVKADNEAVVPPQSESPEQTPAAEHSKDLGLPSEALEDRTHPDEVAQDSIEATESWIENPGIASTPEQADTAANQKGGAPDDEGNDFSFTTKKSRKDKKKDKKKRQSANDISPGPVSDTTPQGESHSTDEQGRDYLAEATSAATAAVAGAAAVESTMQEGDDDWAGFSTKKSKKEKKKAKKSSLSAPAMEEIPREAREDGSGYVKDTGSRADDQDGGKPAVDTEDADRAGADLETQQHEQNSYQDFPGLKDAGEPAGATSETAESPQDGHAGQFDEEPELGGGEHHDASSAPTAAGVPHHDSQDIDFTATVAAGLADSGFDPDLVIADPVFHRRASPTGSTAEADPDEVSSLATTRRRRSKKSPEATGSPEQKPAFPAGDSANDSVPADDFNTAVSESLTTTGFDPALLEKALASSNDQPSGEATGDQDDDFSFITTSKRNKGKKGKKSRSAFDAEPTPTADAHTTGPNESVDLTQDEHGSSNTMTVVSSVDGMQTLEPTPPDGHSYPPQEIAQSSQAEVQSHTETSKEPEASSSQEVNLLNVGHDEMDMDEMDRQYKEYRKNKRKQKKLKAAAKAAGSSDNPESSTAVSDSDALPPRSNKADTLARSVVLEEAAKTQSSGEQPAEEASSAQSPTSRQSAVQSVFAGLERVKRRAPSIPSANEDKQERRSSSSSQGGGLLQHTSEVSQHMPVSVPRSPTRSEKTDRDGTTSSEDRWAAASGAAGLGAAVAAAARERQAKKAAASGPSWSFDSLRDESRDAVESPTAEHQPIRDSGYQEGNRSSQSTERSSREIPEILHTSSSRDSLRERRSLDPLRISTDPDDTWEISSPKRRLGDGRGRAAEGHSRTPSAETPLKPTSKERASYLFQSPPDVLAGVADTTPRATESSAAPQKSPNAEYFTTRSTSRGSNDYSMDRQESTPGRSSFSPGGARDASHDRSTFSPESREVGHERSAFSPVHGPRSPSTPLDAIPEEQHIGKRRKAESDVGGPSQIKAIQRAETPQSIRARQHPTSPPSIETTMNIPVSTGRSTSNPLSTDTLINRLSWPSVDEDQDTVHIDRPLGHRYSKPALPDPRSPSVMSNRSTASGTHFKSPQDLRSYSRNSNRSSTSTHSLRRTSLSGDLRAASRRGDASGSAAGSAVGAAAAAASAITIPFEPPPTPPLNDDELAHASASRAVDMNDDVFQGYGDAQQSQVSPTRPPSVRKRQSMHITDLESRINELAAENRALHEARQYADQTNDAARDVNGQALQEALAARDQQLHEKDAEIDQIKAMLQPLQEEVARLTEINGGLTEANRNLVDDTNGRYATLQAEHTEAHEKWQSASRDLEAMRSEHGRVTSGMRDIIEAEIASSLADKNAEILRLREQLDIAAEQIRSLQVQIQSSKSSDWLVQRDEDYFDGACQKLCQHVQQWVLRFSKLSDNRVCRLSTDLKDDKLEARLDNAILDGSDVDKLLSDRVRRRDVFMSVVMTMVWEYVFTRYLFGMDREQRQKLKVLEKTLAEVGPPRAVAHWRATTLTLLSKRPAFATQCGLDTEAVSHEIFNMLCSLLPPPQNAEQQLFASLQKVMGVAVNLSIEMRTQRAEYIMLPPLQPEYDTNGDLVRKVHFNADLMNERSGFFSSNEELAADHAVVKIVLFPLVVKKGDDNGEGEEEIVVCPAQVLVQNDGGRGKKVVRVMSGALPMDIDQPMGSRASRHSLVSESPGSMQL